MSRSSFAQSLSLLLALSATTISIALPKPQGNWQGFGPTPTTTTASGTSTTAPSTGPTSGTDTSGRRGIAYNASSPDLNIFDGYTNKVGWGYNWGSQRTAYGQNLQVQLPSQYMFVPQLWSDINDHTKYWNDDVKAANPAYVLSFNEPDIPPPQANMPVSQSVASHIQWMNPISNNGAVKIGSVSVSNGVKPNGNAPPMGLEYLGDFLQQCASAKPTPCIVDFVSVHWYGCTNGCGVDADFAAFQSNMRDAMTTAGTLDVWITEFQHFGSEQDQQSFVSQALTWLDDPAQAQIKRYAYFMAVDGVLTTGGQLNSVGTKYAS